MHLFVAELSTGDLFQADLSIWWHFGAELSTG